MVVGRIMDYGVKPYTIESKRCLAPREMASGGQAKGLESDVSGGDRSRYGPGQRAAGELWG